MASQTEIGYVYKITSPSGKIYVGSTNNIENRKRQYKRLKSGSQRRLLHSLLKYGWEAHNFEVICECPFELSWMAEAAYGHIFKVLGSKGLNCKLPKDGEERSCISEETRERLSKASKGKTRRFGFTMSRESIEKMLETRKVTYPGHSEEAKERIGTATRTRGQDWRDKISIANSNPPEERRQKIRERKLGTKASDETRKKQSEKAKLKKLKYYHIEALRNANIGKIHSDETRRKQSEASKIKKLILNIETGIYYDSFTEAAKSINADRKSLRGNICRPKINKTSFICA